MVRYVNYWLTLKVISGTYNDKHNGKKKARDKTSNARNAAQKVHCGCRKVRGGRYGTYSKNIVQAN
jgi:hypothetical protein